MIGLAVTGDDGKPLPQYTKLTPSAYQPPKEVIELFARDQTDYGLAWRLQHRPFDEFDGISLLQRSRLDQQTFGAYVGAQYFPQHKRWRWRGRKNTARNKLINILSHMIAGMLYPLVTASNEENEDDKMSARVMRIIVENHLRKAGYEMKFLYMVLSALVNPASIVKVEYVEAWQRIKENGNVREAIDTFLTGLMLRIVPIDQFLISDFYTGDVQNQAFVVEVDRISYDKARKIWGHNPDFKYVQAGKTRIFLAGQEHLTLFDIEWTEGDRTSVQVITVYRRDEDLQTTWVGGVFMGNTTNVYNTNPFSHRRMSLIEDEWVSVPIYPFAKMFAEPIDPTGRFFYGKSAAFKEYWDDQTQNKMHQLLVDGTYLDVFKPMFISGLAKADSTVIAPGAVIGMPAQGTATMFGLGPNLPAAYQALTKQEQDMSDSTQNQPIPSGETPQGVTATAVVQQQNQARFQLGVLGLVVADLVRQVGELTVDCTIQHTVTAEVDASTPGSLRLKNKTILAKGKERGQDITNKIVFTDKFMGKKMSQKQKDDYEWKLWHEAGGKSAKTVIYHVNPFRFARMVYSLFVDPDQIVNHAMGNSRLQKMAAFQMLTDPRVAPFTDQKNVVDDFVIEEFSDGDPDRYKAKGNVNDAMSAVMGQGQPGQGQPGQPQPKQPTPSPVGGAALPAASSLM